MNTLILFLFAGLAASLVGVGLRASRLFAPKNPGLAKNSPYECGEKTIGATWVQFHVGYYLFGLLFLVFDVEAAFLYPIATVIREAGVAGLVEAGIFVGILLLALAYAWRKGVLEWE